MKSDIQTKKKIKEESLKSSGFKSVINSQNLVTPFKNSVTHSESDILQALLTYLPKQSFIHLLTYALYKLTKHHSLTYLSFREVS